MTNNIKQQLFSGVFYTAIAKYSGIIISLVVAGILARLLSPDDFGIVAIATVIISFFCHFHRYGTVSRHYTEQDSHPRRPDQHLLVHVLDRHSGSLCSFL